MKKTLRMILCLVLTLSLMTCFAACDLFGDDEGGSSKSGSSIAGKYEFYSMTMEGETITAEDLEDMGADPSAMYIEINKDGTAILSTNGEETDMEWEDNMMWPADDEDDKAEFTVSGSKLTLEQDGMEMVFKK